MIEGVTFWLMFPGSWNHEGTLTAQIKAIYPRVAHNSVANVREYDVPYALDKRMGVKIPFESTEQVRLFLARIGSELEALPLERVMLSTIMPIEFPILGGLGQFAGGRSDRYGERTRAWYSIWRKAPYKDPFVPSLESIVDSFEEFLSRS